MASVAAVPRPPVARSGPEVGAQHPRASAAANLRFQDPGLHGAALDPGMSPHPQHHMTGRPLFYLPTLPPPHFLQYQWPMPFSYNPFGGFPGMGYGMVMPPMPPPYMEPPVYIMPHHHVQPVDYRRFQAPVQPPTGTSYQNPAQLRRVRPPNTVPRETATSEVQTVNSEVQTEPAQRLGDAYGEGSPFVGSDSGQATASCSPSSASSGTHKQGATEMEGNANEDRRHAANVPHPVRTKTVLSHVKARLDAQKGGVEENMAPYRGPRCNMSFVSTPESMIPVCSSSQQEDEVVKERRISVPDILMSQESGSHQTSIMRMVDKVLPLTDLELPSRRGKTRPERSVVLSPTKTANTTQDGVNPNEDEEEAEEDDDDDGPFKILKLPFMLRELLRESRQARDSVGSADFSQPSLGRNSLAQQLPDYEHETTPIDQTGIPSQLSLCSGPMKRKMNESVWSVESLAPYVPNKEWLMLNSMFETKMSGLAEEVADNGQVGSQNGHLMVQVNKERRRSRMFSSSGLSEGGLLFSTPLKPNPPNCESKVDVSALTETFKQDGTVSPTEKVLTSCVLSKNVVTPPIVIAPGDGSSEPEATQSPNQDSCILIEKQVDAPCPADRQQTSCATSTERLSPTDQPADAKPENEEECGLKQQHQQLCVPTEGHNMTSVSPSKVDCGTQCDDELQRPKCSCDREKNHKNSDMRKANDCKPEGNSTNGHKNYKKCSQWRHKRQEKQQQQQQQGSYGYSSKAKAYGGDARS